MRIALILIILLGIASAPASLYSQDAGEMALTVTQLAGQDVYLNGGTAQGIAKGDTLVTASGNRFLVVGASRSQSMVQFADAPFPVTRGQLFTIRVIKGSPEGGEDTVAETGENDAAVSIMTQPRDRERTDSPRKPPGIEVNGRLLVSLSGLHSETQAPSSTLPSISRSYATPAVHLTATVSNLPSGMKLRVNLRSDYRYQSHNPVGPENSFRAYQLSLEKDLSFGVVQFGRFYNRMMQRGGYWDGISFLFGSRQRGIGAAAGFMPERSNEGFSTQFPRFALFGHYETPRDRPVIYRGAAEYNEIQPTSLLSPHRYAALEQRVDWSPLSLRQDLQVDHDPISKQWMVSYLKLGSRVAIGKYVNLFADYTIRQPYRMHSLLSPFLNRRDQYRAGVSVNLYDISFGGSYTERYTEQSYQGRTLSGYFNTRPLTPVDVSISGSVSYTTAVFGDVLYVNGGISRSFSKILLRVDYGYYRSVSASVNPALDMNRYAFTASIPFTRRLYWNLRAGMQQGEYTDSYSLQTSLQVRF